MHSYIFVFLWWELLRFTNLQICNIVLTVVAMCVLHHSDLSLEAGTCWLLSMLINGLCVLLKPACINSNFWIKLDTASLILTSHSIFMLLYHYHQYQTPSSTKTGHHWKEWRRVTPYCAWVTTKRLRGAWQMSDVTLSPERWALPCRVWKL